MAFPDLRLDQHDPRRLHEQNPQVAIAAPGYLAEDGTVSGRDLLWNEPQPGGKVATLRLVNTSPAPIAATIALESACARRRRKTSTKP
jgi:hypothetical protein